jgi:NAD(P)-dependent dehydrogenase (short-subunit alcohol dehydrogenase family)
VADPTRPVAIVTGGSRGIGAAVTDALAVRGMTVASFDIQPPARPGPEDASRAYLTVDVSRADETQRAVGVIAERFGRIDVLVNNAGILDCHAVHDTPEDTWDRVMAVNVKSVFLMSRAVIPHLRAGGGGAIVNISSVHAVATVPRLAAYAASKGAVLSLTRQMALDYADDGIRVNAVIVGGVDTEMSAEHGAAMARDGVTVSPGTGAIGRTAQPDEVARAVAFLASAESSFLTGAPLIADGGMLARLFLSAGPQRQTVAWVTVNSYANVTRVGSLR